MGDRKLTFDLELSVDYPREADAKLGRRLYNVIDWAGCHRGQIALLPQEQAAIQVIRPVAGKIDLALIEATARKINPSRSEDHIKSVAMDALSIVRALIDAVAPEAQPVAEDQWRDLALQFDFQLPLTEVKCMADSIKTPATHPNHPVVGHYFKAWAGMSIQGNAIYYCDSYDPAVDFWMTPINRLDEGVKRTCVSPRAIDRTYHLVHDDMGRMFCTWGRLADEEADAIRAHQAREIELSVAAEAVVNG